MSQNCGKSCHRFNERYRYGPWKSQEIPYIYNAVNKKWIARSWTGGGIPVPGLLHAWYEREESFTVGAYTKLWSTPISSVDSWSEVLVQRMYRHDNWNGEHSVYLPLNQSQSPIFENEHNLFHFHLPSLHRWNVLPIRRGCVCRLLLRYARGISRRVNGRRCIDTEWLQYTVIP